MAYDQQLADAESEIARLKERIAEERKIGDCCRADASRMGAERDAAQAELAAAKERIAELETQLEASDVLTTRQAEELARIRQSSEPNGEQRCRECADKQGNKTPCRCYCHFIGDCRRDMLAILADLRSQGVGE